LEAFGEMNMKENYEILENNALIKKDVILQDLAVIGKQGRKKAKHRCACSIDP